MKIIISPAKIQTGTDGLNRPFRQPSYHKQTKILDDRLSKMSKESLGKLMKIKGKLLNDTYDNLHNKKGLQHAINLYNGIVFKEINMNTYDEVQLTYMQKHLRILSAYYGVLQPDTGIHPYRLDMTMKPDAQNLYVYWDETVNQCFKKEEVIINLASIEYSKMVKKPMINIFFKEEQSDESYKIVTVRAKKARGLMVDYMITHLIEEPEQLKYFNEVGYEYCEGQSTETDYVFVLPYER